MSDVTAAAPSDDIPPEKILFIDDEKNVLAAIHRQLRKHFNILPALGGPEGLAAVAKYKPAVVVCDMRMPEMDGVTTLVEIEKRSPETVRIMLTGNADQETAIEAINRGRIFRFLNKPCSEQILRQAIEDALQYHRTITAEKTLLQQTLTGSVRAMADILSLVAPEAFGRSARVKQWARPMADELGLSSWWELELAAMLYPIGLISAPPQVLEKAAAGTQKLTAAEKDILERTPDVARRLLMHIPRLKGVANIVGLQDRGYDGTGVPERGPVGDAIPVEARAMKVLKALAELTPADVPTDAVVAKLSERPEAYDPKVIAAAHRLWGIGARAKNDAAVGKRMSIALDTLLPNDLLLAPIMLASGKMLLSEGIRVTSAQIERLRNIRSLEPIQEPIAIQRVVAM